MLTLATVPTGALDGSPIDESRPHPDWLRASGGLDAPVIEQFENRAGSLAEAHTKHCLVIDLAGVSSLDTTALGALMRIVARSRRGARPLIIVPPDREAAPPMYVSGVDRQPAARRFARGSGKRGLRPGGVVARPGFRRGMSPQETATEIVPLAAPRKAGGLPLNEAIAGRRSVREWSTGSLSSEELSQLLWAAQGVTGTAGERAAPSAGAVHPLLVHLLTAGGVHRYDPDSHCLERVAVDDRRERVADACVEQHFIARAPAVLVLAAARPSARASYGVRGTDARCSRLAMLPRTSCWRLFHSVSSRCR